MKKFLPVLTIALLALPAFAHALSFEVLGKCGETLTKSEVTEYSDTTVFEVTKKVLKNVLKYETNEAGNYISSIAGLGEDETTADGVKRLWGWNFQVGDNKDIKEPPTYVPVTTKDSVKWVYGYITMDLGKTKCVPNADCPFTPAAPADCAKIVEPEFPPSLESDGDQPEDEGAQ